MKFKALSSLIAASTIFVSVLPAKAQYFPTWNEVSSGSNNNSHCSDIVATDDFSSQGSFAQHNNGSINRSNASSSQRASNRSSNTKVGGSYGMFGGSIGHGSNSSSRSSSSNQSNYGRNWETGSQGSFQQNRIISSAKGKNCDGFYDAAAKVQSTQIISNVEEKRIQSQSQTDLFKTLMQGW